MTMILSQEELIIEEEEEEDEEISVSSECGSNHSDSDSSISHYNLLTLQEGLSAETLHALLEFQCGHIVHLGEDKAAEEEADTAAIHHNDTPDAHDALRIDNNNTPISIPSLPPPLCVAYTAHDHRVIAETLERLRVKAEAAQAAQDKAESMENNMNRIQLSLDNYRDIPQLQEPLRRHHDKGTNNNDENTHDNYAYEYEYEYDRELFVHTLQEALEQDGVVRINGVLDSSLCDDCLAAVNQALDDTDGVSSSSSSQSKSSDNNDNDNDNAVYGFGNVFSRHNRYDMYLRPEGIYLQCLQQLLHAQHSVLGRLLHQLLLSSARSVSSSSFAEDEKVVDCFFHEFSCLVADPGCQNQPMHPDAPHKDPNCDENPDSDTPAPMWTVFVALQDIHGPSMGPTHLLLGSHRLHMNRSISSSINNLKDPTRYRHATMRRGDCIVMDARTYHWGGANTSIHRRALLYVTLRNNPAHLGSNTDADFPPNGSLFPDLQGSMKLSDYNQWLST